MGLFDDIGSAQGVEIAPSGVPRVTIQKQPEAPYADAISAVESGGNYKAVGPQTGKGRAVGRYQVMDFNVGPWTEEVLGQRLTPMQFLGNPQAQDAVFKAKFGSYVDKYGPEGAARAWFAGEGGMNDPNRRDVLGTSVADYSRKFTSALGPQTMAFAGESPKPSAGLFDDIPAANPVETRFPSEQPDNPELRKALTQRAAEMTRGPEMSPSQRMATDFDNIVGAASQGTNPNVDRYSGRLVSDQAFEGDDGQIYYKDPASGQVVPTDSKTQVAIRDPADGVVKVFSRAEDTNEGAAVGVARVLSPGLAAGAPTARPAIGIAPPVGQGQKVSEAANRLGVAVPRAVTTDKVSTQRVASALRNVPLAGDPLVKSSARAVEQLGQKASEIAGGFGSGTVVGAGDAAKAGISRYITGTSKVKVGQLYDKVDDLVDQGAKAPLINTRRVFETIASRRENAALPENSKALDTVLEATKRSGMNYKGVKDLRTSIGEMLDNGILPEGMSGSELKQIYGALSEDLKHVVNVAGGTKAAAAFERANQYNALVSGRRESLAKIIGSSGDAPAEKVFDRLVGMASSSSRADISKLMEARKAVGADDWNEFVSGVISQMGRAPATKGGPEALQGADFSPERFLTAYNKLSGHGRSVLFKSGGMSDLSRSLDDIATVSSRFRELQKFANPSGTAQNVTGAGLGASIAMPLIAGDVITPLKIVGSVVGGRALAASLSKPSTAAAIADFSAKYEKALRAPSAPKVALLTIASRNLANTLQEVGVNVSPSEFLRAIQSPAKSAAEDGEPPVPRGPSQ